MKNYRWHIITPILEHIPPELFPGQRLRPEILATAITFKGAIRRVKEEKAKIKKFSNWDISLYILDALGDKAGAGKGNRYE